jgi:hypothetical protein
MTRVAELRFAERFCGPPGSVVAWGAGPPEGRKRPAGSALLDAEGTMLAVARAAWVTIPRPGSAP